LRCLSNIPPHAYGEGMREGCSDEGEAFDSSRIFYLILVTIARKSNVSIIINYQLSIINLLRSNIDLFERSESRSTVFQNRNLF